MAFMDIGIIKYNGSNYTKDLEWAQSRLRIGLEWV